MFSTSSVIATAITPSENASSRPVVTPTGSPPSDPLLSGRQVEKNARTERRKPTDSYSSFPAPGRCDY
jgi:hypothetical protein